jgi:hypothetical protein
MYNNMAQVQKFPISRFDGDNRGFEKSRARSPLASRTYRPGNTRLQYSKRGVTQPPVQWVPGLSRG